MRQIVVTGGGTGIGYAVAAWFVRAGEQVTITGRREHVLKEAVAGLAGLVSAAGPGVPAAGYACFDAADPAAVAAALPQLPGQVDVLVNNAGGNTGFGRAEAGEGDLAGLAADWRANLDANLMSAVLVTAALTPRFAADARIVSLSSIAARRGAGSYGAAKAAVEAWSADVARELGRRGIMANVVSPGLTVGRAGDSQGRAIRTTGTPTTVRPPVTFMMTPTAGTERACALGKAVAGSAEMATQIRHITDQASTARRQ